MIDKTLKLTWMYVVEMWKVEGMQAGVSVNVQEYMGTLHLSVLQCGTYIDKLDVELTGESSWLYQW